MPTTITPRSRTLLRLEKQPDTVCASCPNALWQSLQIKGKPGVRVYCTLMHVLVDELLTDCDGVPDELAQVPVAPVPLVQLKRGEHTPEKLQAYFNRTGIFPVDTNPDQANAMTRVKLEQMDLRPGERANP